MFCEINKRKTIIIYLIFILIGMTIPLSGQSLCDTSGTNIFFWTNQPPKMNISNRDLESILNDQIKLSEYQINDEKTIYLNIKINCKGEHFDYKIINSDNTAFNDFLSKCIRANTSWTPAMHNGHFVDYSYTFKIKLSKTKIAILDNDIKKKK